MAGKIKSIISASRRTDLPAFYYDWLQASLEKGEVELANPRFKDKTYKVNLRPENVHSIVLWSKDFRNVLHNPGYLENYNLYFQYTINNYSQMLEPFAPPYKDSLKTIDGLLHKYRPEQFNIRFDPIILSVAGENFPYLEKPGLARLHTFETLCRDLAALGMQQSRVTTSFLCLYTHVRERLNRSAIKLIHLDETLQVKFAMRMVDIAHKYGITLYSCASPILDQVQGMLQGSCIDGQLLEHLFKGKVSKAKDAGQRKECLCSKSSDIGRYDQHCRFGCLYCYATA